MNAALDAVLAALPDARRSGAGWAARCPAHGDRQASLTVGAGTVRDVVLTCFTGCQPDAIVRALGLDPSVILGASPDDRRNGTAQPGHTDRETVSVAALARVKGLPEAFLRELGLRDAAGAVLIPYHDVDGSELFVRRRLTLTGKNRTLQPSGKKLRPYGLDRLAGWADRTALLLVEGESDPWAGWRHSVAVLGIPGAASASALDLAHVAPFAELFVVEEPDEAGMRFGPLLRRRLDALGWPGTAYAAQLHHAGRRVKDLADLHLAVGGDRSALWAALAEARQSAVPLVSADRAPLFTSTTPSTAEPAGPAWPDGLADEAFYGPLGDVVRAVVPFTEADAAAILAHLASAAGVYLGRDVYALVGPARHPAKLNTLIIGPTSTGRKGTARTIGEAVLRIADEPFARTNVTSGLSSGEGLIWAVRDPIYRRERIGKGADARYEEQLSDDGVEDKRCWVVETEFASVLRVIQRDGSTLSPVIRQAWDGDYLNTLVKNNPARASGVHVAVTGHIVPDELTRYLDRSELAGGFINRFLLIASRRSKELPDGESVLDGILTPFARHLLRARAWAETPRVLRRDDEARDVWHAVYGALTTDRPGIFGSATSRAEAQVLRLSVLYAGLDCSELIRAEHLLAALAVWKYAEASARWAFGDLTGDQTADAILGALRREGEQDRTAIYDLLGRNTSRQRIERALGILAAAGLAQRESETTAGRSREVWRATR